MQTRRGRRHAAGEGEAVGTERRPGLIRRFVAIRRHGLPGRLAGVRVQEPDLLRR